MQIEVNEMILMSVCVHCYVIRLSFIVSSGIPIVRKKSIFILFTITLAVARSCAHAVLVLTKRFIFTVNWQRAFSTGSICETFNKISHHGNQKKEYGRWNVQVISRNVQGCMSMPVHNLYFPRLFQIWSRDIQCYGVVQCAANRSSCCWQSVHTITGTDGHLK